MEKDFSAYDQGTSFNRTALIGFASKGPINVPTKVSNVEDLIRIFGRPNPDVDSYLLYACIDYLREGADLIVVRAGQDDEGSADFARKAYVDIPSGGRHATIVTGVTESTWGGVGQSLSTDRYIRLRVNRETFVRELKIPANTTFASLTNAGTSSATSLESLLAAQLTEDDGFIVTNCGSGLDARLVFRSKINGPNSSLEIVSSRANLYTANDSSPNIASNTVAGDTTPDFTLGIGTQMSRAIKTGTATFFNPSNPSGPAGEWNMSGYRNLRVDVVVFGSGDTNVDGMTQSILLPADANGQNIDVASTQLLVDWLNGETTGSPNAPKGFWFEAVGNAIRIVAGFASTYETTSGGSFTGWYLTGPEAKILVRPSSTASTILGFDNLVVTGTAPAEYEDTSSEIDCTPDASKLITNKVIGTLNTTDVTTLRVFAATPGTEGNYTDVEVSVNPETAKIDFRVFHRGEIVENYNGLHKDENATGTQAFFYVERFVNGFSDFISFDDIENVDDLPAPGTYRLGSLILNQPEAGTDGIPADPLDQAVLLAGSRERSTGLYAIAEPEAIDIDQIAVPGVSTTLVIETMKLICEEIRQDCMFLVDPPFGLTPVEVRKWHNGQHPLNNIKFNSSYGALYWPWLKVLDTFNNDDLWVPPSGSALAVYARTDGISFPWIAPAGLRRGRLEWVKETEFLPYQSVRDSLYADDNAVNTIVDFPQDGPTIWGQKTLQRFPTALDRVNVRRMLLYAEKEVRKRSRFLIFEPHDEILRAEFIKLASGVMGSIVSNRGAYDYIVICDQTLNTSEVIDRNELRARIGVQPTKAAEFIFITLTIHRTGSFEQSSIGNVPTRVR
jgi:hypothetical protein